MLNRRASLAWATLSTGRHLERRRCQLRNLLRARHASGTVPLSTPPTRNASQVRVDLPEHTDMVWHGFLPDARPNQLYGYRIHGPYEPSVGHRFNPSKVVMDPYAKSVARTIQWEDDVFGYTVGAPDEDLSFDTRDSAANAPLAAVVDPAFTWGEDCAPADTVAQHGDLRDARARLHDAPPEVPEASARHLRGAHHAAGHSAPEGTGRDRRRVDAGAPPRARPPSRGARSSPTTGATTATATSHPNAASRDRAPRPAPSASSSGWCARCTLPVSK
jgi:hypothetical protein